MNAGNPKEGSNALQARRIAAAFLLAWGIGLCCWIWGKTGDIAGDFGHELYVAWQMNAGRILYRDLSYAFGPLPACINAIWMRIWGLQVSSILWGNALVLLVATWLLWRICSRCAGGLASFFATAYFLAVFALSSPTRITTFNFLTPYAPGIVHGFVLGLGTIEALVQFHQTGRRGWIILGGLLTGLALLCKPEMFVACMATYGSGLVASLWLKKSPDWKKIIAIAAGALVVPPLIAFILLAFLAGASPALAAVFNGWQFASKQFVLDTPFYLQGFGTDDLPRSLGLIAKTAAIDAGVIGALVAVALALRPFRTGRAGIIASLTAGVVLCFLIPSPTNECWIDADRGLVIWAIAAAAVATWRIVKRSGRLAPFCLLIFSLASLVKIFFNVRTYHYGFVLAAPCMISLILALLKWLPDWVDQLGGSGRFVRWACVGLLVGLAWNRIAITQMVLGERTLTVPLRFGGALAARPVDQAFIDAMSAISQLPPSATLDVLPDGSGINYALGRANPTRFDLADPICLHLDGGEDKVLEALKKNPPDAILLIRIDKSIVGARWFGEDYAFSISAWIQSNYRVAGMFGDQSQEKSAQLFLRNSPP
jgi:dolichyl-phosphate-mannose-protein mannosyltransferase